MNRMRTKVQALLFAASVLAAGFAYSEARADPVVLINPFTVPADKLNETIGNYNQTLNNLSRKS